MWLLSIDNEGAEVAAFLNNNGVDAFVVKFSLVHTVENANAKRDSMK